MLIKQFDHTLRGFLRFVDKGSVDIFHDCLFTTITTPIGVRDGKHVSYKGQGISVKVKF